VADTPGGPIPSGERDGGPPWERERLLISSTSVLLVVASIVVALVMRNVFVAAHRSIGWVVASALAAFLIDPVVVFLARWMKRGFALAITFLTLAALIAGIWAGTYRAVRDEVDRLKKVLPDAAAQIEQSDRFGEVARDFHLSQRVDEFVTNLDERVGTGGEVVRTAAGTVPTYFVCAILTLFFIIFGPRGFQGSLQQISDDRQRERLTRVSAETFRKGRGYILATIAQALVAGALTYLLCMITNVQLAFVLALFVGAFSVIPYMGIIVGCLPALLIAAGTQSFSRAGWLLLAFIGMQAVEAFVIRKRVDARTVRVGPAVVVVVLLLGYAVYGIGGAAYGTAIAVLVVAFADAWATGGAPAPPLLRH
jgi:predicted PurR-regulated permease PerM